MKMQVRIALVVLTAALAVGWWSLRAKNAELEGKLAATPAPAAATAPAAPAAPTTDGGTP